MGGCGVGRGCCYDGLLGSGVVSAVLAESIEGADGISPPDGYKCYRCSLADACVVGFVPRFAKYSGWGQADGLETEREPDLCAA